VHVTQRVEAMVRLGGGGIVHVTNGIEALVVGVRVRVAVVVVVGVGVHDAWGHGNLRFRLRHHSSNRGPGGGPSWDEAAKELVVLGSLHEDAVGLEYSAEEGRLDEDGSTECAVAW